MARKPKITPEQAKAARQASIDAATAAASMAAGPMGGVVNVFRGMAAKKAKPAPKKRGY